MTPLAEANARQHEMIERQAGELGDLRERVGRLPAENDVLRAAQATTAGQEAAEAPEPSTQPSARRWRAWVVYGVVGLVALIAVMLAVVLPWR